MNWVEILKNYPSAEYNESNINEKYEEYLADCNKTEKKELGKYYTPIDVAHLMSEYFQELEYENIADVCCGTGNLIIELLNTLGEPKAKQLLDGGHIYLYDIDEMAMTICKTILLHKYGECANNIHCIVGDFLSSEAHLPERCAVISNPPYNYDSSSKTDLYIKFFNKFLSEKVPMVIITPHSFMGADAYKDFRKNLYNATGKILSYDNVPGNIFKGKKFGIFNSNVANSTRAAITIITEYESAHWEISPFIRFKSEERSTVLNKAWTDNILVPYEYSFSNGEIIYRIDKDLAPYCRNWLNSNRKFKDLVSSTPTEYRLDMANTCRYFLTATQRSLSRTGKITLYFKTLEDFYLAYTLLNSSLGYYFQRITNGSITYPKTLLMNMPVIGEYDQILKNYCDTIMGIEDSYLVYKKNAGKMQENIKLPMAFRNGFNLLLFRTNCDNILNCHSNSTVSIQYEEE